MTSLLTRLAQAKGPDRELDALVGVHVGYDGWTPKKWAAVMATGEFSRDACPTGCPEYTASLDAVLRLLPEGWRFGFEMAGRYDANDLCEAWAWPYESSFDPDWRNGDQGYRSAPDGHRAAHKDVVNAALQVVLRARGIE